MFGFCKLDNLERFGSEREARVVRCGVGRGLGTSGDGRRSSMKQREKTMELARFFPWKEQIDGETYSKQILQ